MRIKNCPNCAGTDLYMTAAGVSANGVTSPNLLPKVSRAQFNVVVCGDCGLTRLFTRRIDIQTLRTSDAWVKVTEPVSPLGLNQT